MDAGIEPTGTYSRRVGVGKPVCVPAAATTFIPVIMLMLHHLRSDRPDQSAPHSPARQCCRFG
ncbi:MAG: hypothetical protein CVV11_06585 [Gammaproteobacteria bacterium HGW-Gammaproteobacteria-15]|nr:MAG: hypothetical protein CVV11_06585 [Gammaproteobacteria bacterium HGW-Gammaproteobacteria-15]